MLAYVRNLYTQCVRLVRNFWKWLRPPMRLRVSCSRSLITRSSKAFAPPKPNWVKQEVIRLKSLMPHAGCRTIAHRFNRRWAACRHMTVSKTYVADLCRRHQYLIYEAQRKLKHRVPRPMPRNRVWGCDLLTKTDRHGTPHVALAILDHASRACLRLQSISDKSSLRLLHELVQAVRRYGRPHYLRTDNEAVFASRLFRLGLWLLGIGQQRTEPGCPWQNRTGGTVHWDGQAGTEPRAADKRQGTRRQADTDIRQWYNHDRPHDHLHGRTPAEVWAGIDVFAVRSRTGGTSPRADRRQDSG